ncbi:unnamed protein product [Amoebophrya sp. A25]|nr:unnamed protein product [Amoebophrya sp. A25]|eukprot:GSA25T00013871001.1
MDIEDSGLADERMGAATGKGVLIHDVDSRTMEMEQEISDDISGSSLSLSTSSKTSLPRAVSTTDTGVALNPQDCSLGPQPKMCTDIVAFHSRIKDVLDRHGGLPGEKMLLAGIDRSDGKRVTSLTMSRLLAEKEESEWQEQIKRKEEKKERKERAAERHKEREIAYRKRSQQQASCSSTRGSSPANKSFAEAKNGRDNQDTSDGTEKSSEDAASTDSYDYLLLEETSYQDKQGRPPDLHSRRVDDAAAPSGEGDAVDIQDENQRDRVLRKLTDTSIESFPRFQNAFVDKLWMSVRSGDGGNPEAGKYRKWNNHKGPAYGGHGADVWIKATRAKENLVCLPRTFRAQHGGDGKGTERGRNQKPQTLHVPIGTIIRERRVYRVPETGEVYRTPEGRRVYLPEFAYQFLRHGDQIRICKGGLGGVGPRALRLQDGRKGAPGEKKLLELEYRIPNDVALLGLPNSGKTALLAALTRAHTRIGPEEFSTTRPNTGLLKFRDGVDYRVTDLPGLLPGAAHDKFQGRRVLRHTYRSRLLVFVVDMGSKAKEHTSAPWETPILEGNGATAEDESNLLTPAAGGQRKAQTAIEAATAGAPSSAAEKEEQDQDLPFLASGKGEAGVEYVRKLLHEKNVKSFLSGKMPVPGTDQQEDKVPRSGDADAMDADMSGAAIVHAETTDDGESAPERSPRESGQQDSLAPLEEGSSETAEGKAFRGTSRTAALENARSLDPFEQFVRLRKEAIEFDPLNADKPFLIVGTKCDRLHDDALYNLDSAFFRWQGRFGDRARSDVLGVSARFGLGIAPLARVMRSLLTNDSLELRYRDKVMGPMFPKHLLVQAHEGADPRKKTPTPLLLTSGEEIMPSPKTDASPEKTLPSSFVKLKSRLMTTY